MIAINYAGSSGIIGDALTRLDVLFPFPYMPPGITFGMARGAIYLALVIWLVWMRTRRSHMTTNITSLLWTYCVTCVLNILWIVSIAQERWYVSVAIIIILAIVLTSVAHTLHRENFSWHYRIPFGLYTGWITIAASTVAISQAVYLNYESLALSDNRARAMMIVALIVTGMLFGRYRHRAQLIIGLWAIGGIVFSVYYA
jgi:hypothetical protein